MVPPVITVAECISRSCTTGWLDWVHGELWLTPTGLVRRRLSRAESRANGLGPTVTAPLPRAELPEAALTRVLAEHATNKVVTFESVDRARLVRGVTAHGLRLVLRDGSRHKLLWLTRDPAYGILADVLPSVLGDRFAGTATS
ncbi:hypothetical protein GCM10009662_21170 [Catellatospora coxensis]|uniref:Uncharacterized protein n=1 Tax=Catellatospora coxensis TaxID=310354 RepID=A0A8J3P9B2_9ACTN|nr:hypothetical protein Cco03nite_57760 [Catellatospora coxensis]